ncbi:carbohydrate-binding family 9-like protein [Candidatus Latescibacterota bacterium]
MLRTIINSIVCFGLITLCSCGGKGLGKEQGSADDLHTYKIRRASSPITVDGDLNEAAWKKARLTEKFVIYTDASKPKFQTQAKMLWDDNYLYIAFIMSDEDVWYEMTSWVPGDKCLCSEEVAEVFIDPDGDGLMYTEIEINPYETLMDLYLDKEFAKGGKANLEWQFKGLKIGVSIDGTVNNLESKDKGWVCELALPFETMAFTSPTKNFPPKNGDAWRLNLYRYNFDRGDDKLKELSAWNMTDRKRGFHAPNRFGHVIFTK